MSLSSNPTPTRMLASATAEDFACVLFGHFARRPARRRPGPPRGSAGDQATCAGADWRDRPGSQADCQLRRDAQTLGQILKELGTFLPVRLDGGQYFSGRVDRFQDEGHQRRSEFPLTVAQLAQEAFSLMGDSFQGRKPKESARALDRVNGAKDACQQRRILRPLFEFDEFLIQSREVLVTLDKEFTNHILILHAYVLHGVQKPCLAVSLLFAGDDTGAPAPDSPRSLSTPSGITLAAWAPALA